jgi:hypothetical protein
MAIVQLQSKVKIMQRLHRDSNSRPRSPSLVCDSGVVHARMRISSSSSYYQRALILDKARRCYVISCLLFLNRICKADLIRFLSEAEAFTLYRAMRYRNVAFKIRRLLICHLIIGSPDNDQENVGHVVWVMKGEREPVPMTILFRLHSLRTVWFNAQTNSNHPFKVYTARHLFGSKAVR